MKANKSKVETKIVESILIQTQFPHRISLSQAAQLSGYHQDYLGQLCRLGKLRAAKIGRNWYTTQSELQALISTSEAEGFFKSQANLEDESVSNLDRQVDSQDQSVDSEESLGKFFGRELDQVFLSSSKISDEDNSNNNFVVKSPVITSNYLISEVDQLPIRLEERVKPSKSHHSLQTLITKMKLDELKNEVLAVTGIVGEMSNEVKNHSEILNHHEELLSKLTNSRNDLREIYAPSLDLNETQKPALDLVNLKNQLESDSVPSRVVWLWPAFTLLLAIVVSGLFVFSSRSDISNQPQMTTIIHRQNQSENLSPQVAGDVVDQPLEVTPEQLSQ